MNNQLKQYFEKHNINYKIHEHPAVFTVAESKNIKINIPGLHTKSLFLRDESNKFYLVCLPGEKRLNLKFLKEKFSLKELHFGSAEELKEELHVTPGSVSIFTMIHAKNTILILDDEIWKAPIVGFHPNINTSTLEITHKELEKFYNSLSAEKYILALN
ncbi:MAG: prolyl-tRNA synthetase associated domain-containing protein [Nanoarchaeota archaeon]|nr:prolyl-tRNA synthetase associated domain-containing protein [Nanoarchaeota archaeon]